MSSETPTERHTGEIAEETAEETAEEVRRELDAIRSSATSTLMVGLGVTIVWLFAYNIVDHNMSPLLAFFKILDGINDLILGMLAVVAIGLGIVIVFTLTNLFTQTITNLYSMRIMENLIRDHLMNGQIRTFLYKLVHINEEEQPDTPFPRYVSSAILVLTYQYVVAWFYLVVFSECLYFAAWSAGVYLDLYQGVAQKLVDEHHPNLLRTVQLLADNRLTFRREINTDDYLTMSEPIEGLHISQDLAALVNRLTVAAFPGMKACRTFFSNSGAESGEAAIKLAQIHCYRRCLRRHGLDVFDRVMQDLGVAMEQALGEAHAL